MNNCIFCKIIKGEIDSAKIWEDDNFLAILDINPGMEGATLVMPKEHYDSNIFKIDDNFLAQFIKASKKTAKILENYFKAERVAMVAEGMEINHAHIRLYPIQSGGRLSIRPGPQKDLKELKILAEKIKL